MIAASTLGIIAGGGQLPAQLVEGCQTLKRPCFVLAFENADLDAIHHVPHKVIRLGAVGEAIGHLRQAGVHEVVLAGSVRRPSLTSLRPDRLGTRLLAKLGKAFFAGDDALLKIIVEFLEEEGFTVVGADTVLAGLLAPAGVLGKIQPSERDCTDIAKGLIAARQLGALDIGQAVIVENGEVLGTEAMEGTDALIERCARLRRGMKSGVLVKAKKPGQETRVDLPAIGPQTVEKIHEAGFAGIAVEAGGSLILERERTIERADALGIFMVGIQHE